MARILTATLAIDSANALVGALVESLVQAGRAGPWLWDTQDYAATVGALATFERFRRGAATRAFTVKAGDRVIFSASGGGIVDSSVTLRGLIGRGSSAEGAVRLSLAAAGTGAPVYYYFTVRAVPQERGVRPEDAGIQVERWYEKFDDHSPIIAAAEGEVVRVRLRVTVPTDRQFVALDDALPAGLEAIDLSLRTVGGIPGPGAGENRNPYLAPSENSEELEGGGEGDEEPEWYYGSWDAGWWSPFDHKEMRDERVVYFATVLWKGTYTATYLARATTPGVFVRPPARAEEMYNPAVHGRSDGGVFTVTEK